MSQHTFIAQGVMFGFAASYALAPALKRARSDIAAHDLYDTVFRHLKLCLNGFKWGAVFPGHFYNAADLAFG